MSTGGADALDEGTGRMSTRGWESVKAIVSPAKPPRARVQRPVVTRSKFGAVRTVVHGITFASKAEARRYAELMARHVVIRNLELQPRFPLKGADGSIIGTYVADFRYQESMHRHGPDGEFDAWTEDIVEDVKGVRTPVYRLKKKLFEAQYGIQIREIR
jgi:hypothetical protein